MILSDQTIQAMLSSGELAVSPLDAAQIQPASIDIRLGNTFSMIEDTSVPIVQMEKNIAYKTIQTEQ